ncbi:hypothetical protein Nepgr_019214 [Nepenthes gracilis]|uniref:Uncharacterized protein n=1 Tax=Nepenthes gracilis TaxID=150966 RepID=A0AAD3SSY9_NEPGR|nr:hypothetical protein Nepgr_019214 [Nepenthes gracilis]
MIGHQRGIKSIMFRSKPIFPPQCKRHPKHRQSPGVCSLCLTEKLSKLSAAGSVRLSSYHPSSSSSSSLSSSSSDVSPCDQYIYDHMSFRGYRDSGLLASDASATVFNVLNKSRSEATGSGEVKNRGKENIGFWLKFLRPRTEEKRSSSMYCRIL